MKSFTYLRRVSTITFFLFVVVFALALSGRMENLSKLYGSGWANPSASPEGKDLRTVAVDPLKPQKLFTGTPKGVFVSIDGGKLWKNCLDLSGAKFSVASALSPAQRSIVDSLKAAAKADLITGATALAIDPANSQRLIAGGVDGIYLTSDAGQNWSKADSGAIGGGSFLVLDLAIDPSNPDIVYAGTLKNKLLMSRDSGRTWTKLDIADEENTVTTVAVYPFDSKIVLLGTPDAVMKTQDGCKSWKRTLTEDRGAVRSLAIDQANPKLVYMGTSRGLYKSVDTGASWVVIGAATFDGKGVNEVAVAPSDSNAVYLASASGVYGSADGGISWQKLSKGATVGAVKALAFDPVNSKIIWAAAASGLYKTSVSKAEGAGLAMAEEVKPEKTKPTEEVVETIALGREPSADEAEGAEGPAVPTIDDVKTVLDQFSYEPSVQEIQEVAMRFAEVHPDLIEGWRKGAKWGALLPRFDLHFDFDRQTDSRFQQTDEVRTQDRREWGTFEGFVMGVSPVTGTDYATTREYTDKYYTRRQTIDRLRTEERRRRDRDLTLRFRWELSDFLYNREQIRISDEVRDLVELRNDVLEEVTQFYFQRRQLQIDTLLSPPEDLRERLRMELQLQEVTANIDYLTGGYLTQRLNEAEAGKVGKSNIFKRVFDL